MAVLQTVANQFRQAVASREESAASEMVRFYGSIYAELEADLNAITRKIIQAQQQGLTVSPAWIYQQTRLLELTRMVESELSTFATYAERNVANSQLREIQKAQEDSRTLIFKSLGPIEGNQIPINFLKFNPAVVEAFTGRSSDGTPLNDLFRSLFKEEIDAKVAQLRSVFVNGIIRGLNPADVAKTMNREFETPLKRALTISRTEVLNAYRDTSSEFYRQNPEVVIRWRWVCAHQDRTCAMCLAMDGREFPTQIDMGTHPNCRCTLIPVTKTWEELGFKGVAETSIKSKPYQTGEDWFKQQSEATQRRILGPEKFDLFQAGELTLKDTIGYKDDPKWGPTRWERSIKQIQANSFAPPADLLGTYGQGN